MEYGIDRAKKNKRTIEYRTLEEGWRDKELRLANNHSHAIPWGLNHFHSL